MHTSNNKNHSISRPKMNNQDLCKEACKWRAGRLAAATPASNSSSSNRWWLSRRNWIRPCHSPMLSQVTMEELDQPWCWPRTRRSHRVIIQPANPSKIMRSRHRHIRSFKNLLMESRAKINKLFLEMATLIRFQTRTRRVHSQMAMGITMQQMLIRLWAASRRCTSTIATWFNNITMASCQILSPEMSAMSAYMGSSRRATIHCFRITKTARMDPTMAWSSRRGCSRSWQWRIRKWHPNRIWPQ